jgi:(p)ppGpp synthase/HD superfamily hydrolase
VTALSDRFTAALVHAMSWHAAQVRKATGVPYISHLLAVASLVIEDGGSEVEAIAGLLHDTLEDTDVEETTIRNMFGDEVARIVVACSDTFVSPKPPWLERKTRHLEHLGHQDASVLRVTAADKLHNCRDLVTSVRQVGPRVLDRFAGGVDGTCWYYAAMSAVLQEGLKESRLPADLDRETRTLHGLLRVMFPAARPTA